ncbi:MAG: hypothetical protein LBL92_04720, partial [Propionibacteriaceae bacterium]|nr:hypothetical protein [Propionibacteriaceae bacterium]
MSQSPHLPVAPNPCDLPGVTWQPISSRLATARLIGAAIGWALVDLAALTIALIGQAFWWWLLVVVVVGLTIWTMILIPRHVRAI